MATTEDNNSPQILYIMGAGRSGTTILEVVLTGCAHVAGVGEVTHLFKDGYIEQDFCACGVPAPRCDLWGEVYRVNGWTDEAVRRFASLFRRLDWHAGFLSAWLGRQDAVEFAAYADANRKIFQQVAAAWRVNVVVDSSKYAARALNLNRIFSDKVRVICMTRSPEGLLNSFQKAHKDEQKPKSHLALLMYYLFILVSMRVVAARLGDRVCVIRYEELVSEPDQVLAGLERWLAIDLSEPRRRIATQAAFSGNHIVTGNRLRKAKEIVFRIDRKQPTVTGGLSRVTVWLMHGLEKILGIRGHRISVTP